MSDLPPGFTPPLPPLVSAPQPGKRVRWIDWLVCGAFFILGILLLSIGEYGRRRGVTLESELTVVTGPAVNVSGSNTYHWLTVAGYQVQYSSSDPGFDRLLQAIRNQEPLTVGVLTNSKSLIPRNDWVPLYTLHIGSETLLPYEHSVAKAHESEKAVFIVGGFLTAQGAWGLWLCLGSRRKPQVTPEEFRRHLTDPRRARRAGLLFSIAIYAALMFAMLDEKSLVVSAKTFGASPLGLPIKLFVVLFFTFLYLPVPFAALHFYRLLFRSMTGHGETETVEELNTLREMPPACPERRKSRCIVLSTIAFYALLIVFWILYAEFHHF